MEFVLQISSNLEDGHTFVLQAKVGLEAKGGPAVHGGGAAMRPVRSALSVIDAWVESYRAPAPCPALLRPAALPAPTRAAPKAEGARGGEAHVGGVDVPYATRHEPEQAPGPAAAAAAAPAGGGSSSSSSSSGGGGGGEVAAAAAPHDRSSAHADPGKRGAGILGALGYVARSSMRVLAGRRGLSDGGSAPAGCALGTSGAAAADSERVMEGEMLREQGSPHDINPPRLPSPIEGLDASGNVLFHGARARGDFLGDTEFAYWPSPCSPAHRQPEVSSCCALPCPDPSGAAESRRHGATAAACP